MAKNNRGHRKSNNRSNYNSNFVRKTNYPTEITYTDGITVGQLAEKLERNSSELIKVLFMLGNMVTINSPLDDDAVSLLCMEFNCKATKEEVVDPDSLEDNEEDDEKDLEERPCIVTIMGHVDHGKTTLLDYIRNSHITKQEFGGITQHIGAYQVSVNGKKITFLDTPGHEAFTAMRARGAKVTDLCIIVVAADDGVMPQTREAIDHAKAANCPIIVAVNKMDKPNVNPDRIKNDMSDLGLMPEEWGGDTIFVEISAKTGMGVENLLETIQVVSEVQQLRANPKKAASGSVIEAKLDKGRGPVATLLVQNGTLRVGDPVVVGACFGKIRKMNDDMGRELREAPPSTPVEIIGLNDVPIAGDLFKAYRNERQAREIAARRNQAKIESERRSTSALTLDDLSAQIEAGNIQEIPVIIKADVTGSAEAVKASLEKINVEGVKVNVIRSTAGAISESDVMLASASHAIIYGFNVRPDSNVRKKAAEELVEIRLHNIIYKLVEEMETAMKGMLAPVYQEVILGQAEVRQLFKVSRIGTIAGCYVTEGKIVRDCAVRLIRNGIVVYDGRLGSLRRFENDVREVITGYECGLTIANYNDIKEGDIVEAYGEEEVPVE